MTIKHLLISDRSG